MPYMDNTLISYHYQHSQTNATTGYFTCVPEFELTLQQLATALELSPFDTFLRRYALNRFSELSPAQLTDIVSPFLPSPALAAFLLELQVLKSQALTPPKAPALTAPTSAESSGDAPNSLLPGAALLQASASFSPLLLLPRAAEGERAQLEARWAQIFSNNLSGHEKIPDAAQLPSTLEYIYPTSLREQVLQSAAEQGGGKSLAELVALQGSQDTLPEADAPQMPADEVAALALERLQKAGAAPGQEQRHEASLSPVGLLLPWEINLEVQNWRNNYTLRGTATSYGRGLSLPAARASCRMEAVERFSSYVSVSRGGAGGNCTQPVGEVVGRASAMPLYYGRRSQLLEKGLEPIDPTAYYHELSYADEPLHWVKGVRVERSLVAGAGVTSSCASLYASSGVAAADTLNLSQSVTRLQEVFVPLQMVSLFCNLDEVDLCSAPTSTGIATGSSLEMARLAALTEVLERDAEACTVYHKSRCFTLDVSSVADAGLAALLQSYASLGINVQFMELNAAFGLPCYQSFVIGARGQIYRGHGAGLNAKAALLSAITETPFAYPHGGGSGFGLRRLPARSFGELPNYSLGSKTADLALLELMLCRSGAAPVYVELTHAVLEFPVVRALVPRTMPMAEFDEFTRLPAGIFEDYLRVIKG